MLADNLFGQNQLAILGDAQTIGVAVMPDQNFLAAPEQTVCRNDVRWQAALCDFIWQASRSGSSVGHVELDQRVAGLVSEITYTN